MLNPEFFNSHDYTPGRVVGKDVKVIKRQQFYKGFVMKMFPAKMLQTQNVKPTFEEVRKFSDVLNLYFIIIF